MNFSQHTQKMQKLYWRGERLPSVEEQNALIEIVVAETLAWAEEQVVPRANEELFTGHECGKCLRNIYCEQWNLCRAQIINSFKEIQGL